MARTTFGGDITQLVVAPDAADGDALKVAANTAVPLYTAPGGTLVTDFLLWDGSAFTIAATQIISNSVGNLPRFQGPDARTILYDANGAALHPEPTGGGTTLTTYAQVSGLSDYPASFPPSSHGHVPADVGATTTGASLMQAADAAAARAAIAAAGLASPAFTGTPTATTAAATDASTRIATTQHVSDKITANAPNLTGYATKAGSVNQFADVADTAPADGNMLRYDAATASYAPVNPTTQFAAADPSTSRLAQSAYPKYLREIVVINEGSAPPSDTPVGAIVLSRPSVASLVPTMLASGDVRAASAITLTVNETLAVNDYIGISVGCGNEVGLASFTVTYSAGAGAVTWEPIAQPNTSAAVNNGFAKITTQVPSGSTITITARDSGGAAAQRAHLLAAVYRLPGIAATSPLDQTATSGGSSTTNLTAISAGPTATTTQPNEVGIGTAVWTVTATTGVRTLAGTNGWQELVQRKSDNGTSARGFFVAYRVLNTQGTVTFTTQMTSNDGSTGTWAAALGTKKAA